MAVYDAQAVFAKKSDMALYPVQNLGKGDLVLLEMWISRYRIKPANEPSGAALEAAKSSHFYKPRPFAWDRWRARFDLRAVSLLQMNDEEEVLAVDNEADVFV